MADNSWFTVFTTLFSTSVGAGLTYLANFLAEKRRIKFDEAKENRAEQKRLNKKAVLLIDKIGKYRCLMIELHGYFTKDILETAKGYLNALSDIKSINIPHQEITISDDDVYDIFQISGQNAFNAVNRLGDKINSAVSAIDLYNQRYQYFLEELKKSKCDNPDELFFRKNRNLILEIVGIGKTISLLSKDNVTNINNFLSVFVNGDNFYAKNIELKLPTLDGGFETIKRTVS